MTENSEGQPWVAEGHHLFSRDIYLHALNLVEPLYMSLVMRTLGLIQGNVDFAELEDRARLSTKYTGFTEIDWADQFDDEYLIWLEGGTAVMETEITSEIYLQNFLHHYADRPQLRGAARVRMHFTCPFIFHQTENGNNIFHLQAARGAREVELQA